MSKIWLALAVLVAGAFASPVAAQKFGIGSGASSSDGLGSQQVHCASHKFEPARCDIEVGRMGSVQLLNVTNEPCKQGRTWGWDAKGIWVNGNCRADFLVRSKHVGNGVDAGHGGGYPGGGYPGNGGYPGGGNPGNGGYPGQGRTIACNSFGYQPARCAIDTRGGVTLVRQTAGQCNQGRSWGYDPGGIWVNGGCQGIFAVAGRGGQGGGFPAAGIPGAGNNARFIVCESHQSQPARCATDVYNSARLVENSNGKCNSRNWGWDRGGVWVNGGCKGRFQLF